MLQDRLDGFGAGVALLSAVCGTVCRDCVPGLYVWTTEGRLPSVPGGGWAAPVVAPSGDGRTRGQISQGRLDGFGAGVALLSAARFYS